MKLTSLLLFLGSASAVSASDNRVNLDSNAALRRALAGFEEGNAFKVTSEIKSKVGEPHEESTISLTFSRDRNPSSLLSSKIIPSLKSNSEDDKVSMFISPFFMNHIPIGDLLRPFRGERKVFERDFAEAISSVVKELKKENVFVQSILTPLKEVGARAYGKSKIIFHDLIEIVTLKNLREDGDNEMGLKNLRDGFTRIEWFYIDREKKGFEGLKEGLEKAKQMIGDLKSPFWRATPFGRKILSIPDRILSTMNQINDNLQAFKGNLHTSLRGGAVSDSVRGSVSAIANDIATINRNVNSDVNDIRQNIRDDIGEMTENLTDKMDIINVAVNSDIHAINDDLSDRIETINNTLNGDISGFNKAIKEKIAAASDIASKDTKQYSHLNNVIKNEIDTVDGRINSRIDLINSSMNHQIDQINSGIDNINQNIYQLSARLQNDGNHILHFIFTPKLPFKKILLSETDVSRIEQVNFTHNQFDQEEEKRLFRIPILQLGQRPANMRILDDASKDDYRVIGRVFPSQLPSSRSSTEAPSSSSSSTEAPSSSSSSTEAPSSSSSSTEAPSSSSSSTEAPSSSSSSTEAPSSSSSSTEAPSSSSSSTEAPSSSSSSSSSSTTSTSTYPCVEENFDYHGHDIQKIEDYSVHSCTECQALCQENADCFFWTFNVIEHWCYLKGKDALEGRQEQPKGFKLVSGNKICQFEENVYPKVPCHAEGVDFFGYDVEKIEGEDTGITKVEDCLQACKANARCYYFTFNTKNNSCYLKGRESVDGWVHNTETLHLISGAKRCVYNH